MWKFAALGLVALSACGPSVPESGASLDGRPVDIGRGVGFGSYEQYEQARIQRERVLASGGTGVVPPGPVISDEQVGQQIAGTAQDGRVISSSELASAGLPVEGAGTEPGAAPLDGRVATNTTQVAPAPIDPNNPAISDEQDFDAVSARETIESDAERLARQRQAREIVAPAPVPTRDQAQTGPNIVQFALNTSNAVGEQLYSRSSLNGANRAARACAGFPSPDLAQQEFLRRGGPERDRLGLDPDGDGFACSWDPRPFRNARG